MQDLDATAARVAFYWKVYLWAWSRRRRHETPPKTLSPQRLTPAGPPASSPVPLLVQFAPYVAVSVLGLIFGILYVTWGWQGSEEKVKLPEDPRIKNLTWVLGGALLTFIADFKQVDPGVQRADVVVCYLVVCVVTILLTLGAYCLHIAREAARVRRENPAAYPAPPFAPVMEYLTNGYLQYKAQFQKAVAEQERQKAVAYTDWASRVLPFYSETITLALGIVRNAVFHPETAIQGVPNLLDAVCLVVKACAGDKEREIHARFFRVIPAAQADTKTLERLRFVEGDPYRFPHYLVLESNDPKAQTESLTLPVEAKGGASRSLPGGPLAFLEEEDQVVDDVLQIDYPSNLSPQIRVEVEEYFKRKRYRSFAALLLRDPQDRDRIVGILTVESNLSQVFGDTNEKKSELNKLVRPLALLLELAVSA